jgi:hypothetical protein
VGRDSWIPGVHTYICICIRKKQLWILTAIHDLWFIYSGFIGYASDLYKLVTHSPIKDSEDDQLYFTKLFLDDDLRTELKIKLDTKSTIFHNLNGATSEVELWV